MKDGINRKNLQKLATFLMYGNGVSKGVKFNMALFTDGDEHSPVCETAGCAVGFAPFAGIRKFKTEDFDDYACRALIDPLVASSGAFSWCFAGWWEGYDNTRKGAAKRIQYLLDNGVPANFINMTSKELRAIYANTTVQQG